MRLSCRVLSTAALIVASFSLLRAEVISPGGAPFPHDNDEGSGGDQEDDYENSGVLLDFDPDLRRCCPETLLFNYER